MAKKLIFKKKTQKQVADSKFLKTLLEGDETPILDVYFCGIVKPQYFTGSTVPRYKIGVSLDRKVESHKKYLEALEKIATKHEVKTIGRVDDTNAILMSFQGRVKPEIYMFDEETQELDELELEHDLPANGLRCKIVYDLRRYYDRRGETNAFNYSPTKITFYFDKESKKRFEVVDGSCEDSGD